MVAGFYYAVPTSKEKRSICKWRPERKIYVGKSMLLAILSFGHLKFLKYCRKQMKRAIELIFCKFAVEMKYDRQKKYLS